MPRWAILISKYQVPLCTPLEARACMQVRLPSASAVRGENPHTVAAATLRDLNCAYLASSCALQECCGIGAAQVMGLCCR